MKRINVKLLIALAAMLLLGGTARAEAITNSEGFYVITNPPVSVALAWDLSPASNVVGYFIYYGVASGSYTNRTSVGNTNTATIGGLKRSSTYFFAATCYDTAGLESEFSNEVSYRTPDILPPVLNLHTNAVLLGMKVEIAPTPKGPWSLYATLATEVSTPGYYRTGVQINRLTPANFLPIPGR